MESAAFFKGGNELEHEHFGNYGFYCEKRNV